MKQLSLIVPVYNRAQEVEELLASLLEQEDNQFEVILVEDGSTLTCRQQAQDYTNHLSLQYYFKKNSGPGLSRNYGAERAQGDYFIFLDSDCVLPPGYVKAVRQFLTRKPQVEAFGGPDRARRDFTPIQKAINYSMTAFLTTGGIRGGGKRMEKFHPRSFNMGLSRRAYDLSGGFSGLRFGEDIDLSIRIHQLDIPTALIPEAFVYHKRRTHFRQFFKQIYNSGIARINLHKRHPGTLKSVHFFPAFFTLGWILALLLLFLGQPEGLYLYLIYAAAIFIHASLENKSLKVGLLSVASSFIQLSAYGWGFIYSFWRRMVLGKGEFARFERNFYD